VVKKTGITPKKIEKINKPDLNKRFDEVMTKLD